jgi:Uri superfamily endonuclease
MEGAISRDNCDEEKEVGRIVYYSDPNIELDDTYSAYTSNWFGSRDVFFKATSNEANVTSSDIQKYRDEQTINLDSQEKLELYTNAKDKFKISTINSQTNQKDTIEIYKIPNNHIAWTEARRKMEWKRWNTTSGFYGCTKRVDRYLSGSGYALEMRYEWRRLDLIGKENQMVFAEIYDSNFEHGIASNSGSVELIAEDWACDNLVNQGETGRFVHKCTALDGSNSNRYSGKCVGHIGEFTIAPCGDRPYDAYGRIITDEVWPCTLSHTYSYNHVCSALDIASGKYGCSTEDARMHCTCDNQDGFAPCQTIEDIDYNYE